MKYIMIHKQLDEDQAVTYPIIFPNELNHCDIADQVLALLKTQYPKINISVVSAGFINLDNCKTHGHSETLNLQSGDTDDLRIRLRDYFMFDEVKNPLKIK